MKASVHQLHPYNRRKAYAERQAELGYLRVRVLVPADLQDEVHEFARRLRAQAEADRPPTSGPGRARPYRRRAAAERPSRTAPAPTEPPSHPARRPNRRSDPSAVAERRAGRPAAGTPAIDDPARIRPAHEL